MTLKIGKQRELPKRPGDWKTVKGDMNQVPDDAAREAEELRRRFEKPAPKPEPKPKAEE